MRAFTLCLSMSLLRAALFAQSGTVIAVPEGEPDDVTTLPATMELTPKAAGARAGKIWVRSTDEGLHVWGKVQVNDGDLQWPKEKSEMLASDHVEIWLSASAKVEMPPIGYGNQFGENDLRSVADCASTDADGGAGGPPGADTKTCERWYGAQVEYRKQFERLFTRQWLTAGPGAMGQVPVFEDFANSAWANLNKGIFENALPKALEPRGREGVVSDFEEDFGKNEGNRGVPADYRFHFFVPWSAFPPTQELNLKDLWLMVDVFGAAPEGKKMGPLSTTSPDRVWGRPSSFNHLALDAPRKHEISPCQAPGEEQDMYGKPHAVWYFPMNGKEPLELSKVYDIENPAGGYMYAPDGVSPIFKEDDHFWKTAPDGAIVCGPELGWRKSGVAKASTFPVEQQYFEAKALSDGWLLVRTGPDMSTLSAFGSGQCGACPVVNFRIYTISPKGEMTSALDINDVFSGGAGEASDGDFAVVPDWKKITFYESFDNAAGEENESWKATSYCLQDHTYAKCGEDKNAKPPDPPNFKLNEQ